MARWASSGLNLNKCMFYNFVLKYKCLHQMNKTLLSSCASFADRPQFKALGVLMGLRRLKVLGQCRDSLCPALIAMSSAKKGRHFKSKAQPVPLKQQCHTMI